MTHPAHTVLSDAEALFTSAFSWTDALASTAEAVGQTVAAGSVAAVAVLALVGLALRARAPRRSRSVSSTLPTLMTRTFLLLAALLLAAPAFAQTHAEAMARLAPFAGSYLLDGTAIAEPGGTFGGTLDVSPTLGGHFQQWDWEMTMPTPDGDGPYAVQLRFITTYNVEAGAYEIWRFDVRDVGEWAPAGTKEARGTLRFEGDAIVMAWPAANPADPSQTGTFRNTIRLRDGGIEVVTDAVLDDGSPNDAIARTRATRR